jgi:serine protease Do
MFMRSTFLTGTRRWLGASALALLVAIGGVSTALVATSGSATAQMQNVAQIEVPATTPLGGFADLVEAVRPAVVSIRVEGEAAQQGPMGGGPRGRDFNFNFPDLPQDHPFRDFFDQFGDQFGGPGGEGPAEPRRFMAAGSGFVISADGYIVTNNHVVSDAETVTVVYDDGTEQTAEVVGSDERTDLAVIKVEGEDLPFVTFEDERSRVGDWVVAVGNPFGLGGTVTVGIISASGRDIGGGNSYGDFLQIDAAVNTGNSGGPAFNLEGEVVGVNTAIFSPNGGNVGIAFAIPASTVQQIIGQLIEDGSVTRGYLGVSIQDVTSDIADGVGLEAARGAIVREPAADGPGAAAGVQAGDVVLEVDGELIDDALDLSRTIASKAPGSTVELLIWRDGAETTLSVTLETLEEQVADAGETAPTPPAEVAPAETSMGLTLVPNSGGSGGLLIQEIDPQGPAADSGLSVGDAILTVDNTPVSTLEEFEAALESVRDKGLGTALVQASRGGEPIYLGLPLPE